MSLRTLYFISFLMICALLFTSFDLQFYHGIEPCPLCSLQRIAFIGIGIWLCLGFFFPHKKISTFIISILTLLTALLGFALAGRQIWLQHFPPVNGSECGVSLQYMLQVLPMNEIASKIFAGTAECTQRGFDFLSLNMAEWSALWFVVYIILGLYLLCMAIKKK